MRRPDQIIYNFLLANGIANTPACNDAAIRAWGLNLINVYEHYDSYLQNVLAHDAPGPIEKHPYLDTYEADFDLKHGGFLLLGTFPPSSYFNNLPLANLPNPNIQNNIPTHYFYGNTAALWNYLFGLQGPELTIPAIRAALKKHQVSISDVFSYAQRRVMRQADDAQYRNIVLNCRIGEVFQPSSKIHTLLFTSGSLRTFLGNNTSALTGFRWILEDCLHGLEYFSISGSQDGNGPYHPINPQGVQAALLQQEGGIIWWLRSSSKQIRIINLPSPAGNAAIQMLNSPFFRKWVNYKLTANGIQALLGMNDNVREFLHNHPGIFTNTPTQQYRREVYQMVLNGTINQI